MSLRPAFTNECVMLGGVLFKETTDTRKLARGDGLLTFIITTDSKPMVLTIPDTY